MAKRVICIHRAYWLVGGLVLVGASLFLRTRDMHPFVDIFTRTESAQSLFRDHPNPVLVLEQNFARLSFALGRTYLIPIWGLFVPGVLMVLRALAVGAPSQWTRLAPSRRAVWALLATAALVACLLAVHVLVLQSRAFSSDEFDYLFQARILSHGRLSLESPPLREFFSSLGVINDGHTYGRYQIGWPLLLAVGLLVHLPALVNPLLGALSLWLLYQLGKSLFDATTGVLAVLLFMVSPFFVLNAASYSIHPAVLCGTLGSLVCYQSALRGESRRWLAACGVTVVLLTLTRLVDLLAAVPLMVVMTTHQYGRSLRALTRPRPLFLGLCVTVGVGLQLAINRAQTGEALLFAFNVYDPNDRWGFGAQGHTAIRALSNVIYYLTRLIIWMPALFVESSVFGLWPSNRWSRALAYGALLQIAFYAAHFSLGVVEYGPRYWFVPAAFLSILAARGMVRLVTIVTVRSGRPAPAIVAICAGAMLLVTAAQQVAIARSVEASIKNVFDPLRQVDRVLAQRAPAALVFVRSVHIGRSDAANGTPADFIRNDPQLTNSIVYVFYLAPEDNRRLIASMPERTPFELSYDDRQGGYIGRPYRDPVVESDRVDAFLDAGLNYLIGLKQLDRAASMMRRVLAIDVHDYRALRYLGEISRDQGDLSAAVLFWRQSLALHPDMTQVRYALATTLLQLGQVAEAEPELQRIMEESPQSSEGQRAAAWQQDLKTIRR